MDPERNHEGKAPDSGDHSVAVSVVSVETVPSDVPARDEVNAVEVSTPPRKPARRTRPKAGTHPNNVRKLRQGAMMSKAELARRAGVSPLTIDRVEAGCPCRMDTKRKILEALGLQPSAARQVFPDLDLQA